VYDSVLDHVQHEFVEGGENCDNGRLSSAALSRMLASLDDPATRYLDPEARAARQDALRGKFHGIGAALTVTRVRRQDIEYRYLSIVDAMPDSPAARAGLRTGDRITSINGHWVIAFNPKADIDAVARPAGEAASHRQPAPGPPRGITLSRALLRLTAGSGVPLALTVDRPGRPAPFQVTVTTAATTVDPVDFRIVGDHTAFLRIRLFCPAAADRLQQELGTLDTAITAVVVDLRGCPGGVRAESDTGVDGYGCALMLLSLLTRGGAVGELEKHRGQRIPIHVDGSTAHPACGVVVIVDEGTANLAEFVAAGLHAAAHARIVGARTFGDDVLPLLADLKSGAGIEVGSAHLFTAGGADLGQGVLPDIAVVPEAGGVDFALNRALEVVGG
jgi:carboxyl-terminal processing protease